MSDKNTNSAAEAVAELTKVYNEALEVQTNLPEDATDEAKLEAQTAVDNAKTALDEVSVPVKNDNGKKEKLVKIKILLPVAGKFLLPYNVDQVVRLSENQATELVDSKYAEYVK